MPEDPPPRRIIPVHVAEVQAAPIEIEGSGRMVGRVVFDFSGVRAVRLDKRPQEYPVTLVDLAIAFYVCQHWRYPDLPAIEINRWLRTPLGAEIEARLLGRRPRGTPPGPRHDPDAPTFARRVIAAMRSLMRDHRPVLRYVVAQQLYLSPDTYARTLRHHHLDHDDLLRRALDR